MRTLAAFQLLSFGILPLGAMRTITAEVTFVTAPAKGIFDHVFLKARTYNKSVIPGGDPNDFSSVKLFLFNVFKAS